MRVSRLGAPLTGSDMPVPRLSNLISRENDPRPLMKSPMPGSLHCNSTCVTKPGTKMTSNGPSPAT